MSDPATIANRVLDAIGWEGPSIGDLEEGTEQARPILRAYGNDLRQLLRTANWNFARKQAPMQLLADATGQTQGVGTIVPPPWVYEYAWPIDCVRARFVPHNPGAMQNVPQFTGSFPTVQGPPIPGTVSMTGLNVITANNVRLVPARFLVTLDYNYPTTIGAITDWSQLSDLKTGEGDGGTQRTVILTNVRNASLIYTALVVNPAEMDNLFVEAFVQLLASRVALSLTKDKKYALAIRAQAIASCKDAIKEARVSDGNENWATTEHMPDFLRIRSAGPSFNMQYGWWGDGPGTFGYGWDTISFGDG